MSYPTPVLFATLSGMIDVVRITSIAKHYGGKAESVTRRMDICADKISQLTSDEQDELLKSLKETVERVDRKRMQIRIAKHILRYPGTYDENFDSWMGKNSISGKLVQLYKLEPVKLSTVAVWGLVLCPDFAFLMDAKTSKERILEILQDYVNNRGGY